MERWSRERFRSRVDCKLAYATATNRSTAMLDITRSIFLPVVIGTPRQGRLTEPAANFVFGEVSKRGDIETELIDIRKIPSAWTMPVKRLRTRSSRPRSHEPTV